MQIKVMYSLGGLLLAMVVLAAVSGPSVPESRGQDAVVNENSLASDNAAKDNKGFLGSAGCVQCHQGLSRALNSDSFVPLTEPAVWLTDPHSKAFEFIFWSASTDPSHETTSQKLSREICGKLKITDILTAKQCLSCHANWVEELDEAPPLHKLGVACESCHGPADRWEREHARQEWRTQSVDYKSSLGMVDVRNPVRRAEQCFSCHIGNVEQGKRITHAMYAAGHPPLPSIEIESFARQMPRHWRYLKEKITDSRRRAGAANGDAPPFKFFAEFVRENHAYLKSKDAAETLEMAKKHNHGAAAVVLGGAVAPREAIELTRDLTLPDPNNPAPWPELAAFDCTACHHDLKQPPPERTSGGRGRLGRPAWHAWPTALIQLAVFHISVNELGYKRKLAEFNTRLDAVRDNFDATPFGDPSQLQKDATELAQWLTDELINPVAAKPFDNRAVRLTCLRLAHMGSQIDHDFDSARQIAWALRTVYCDLDEKPAADERIQILFRRLASELRLDLPNSSSEVCETTAAASSGASRENPVPLTGSVAAALATEIQFAPQRFKETMLELESLLK